MSHFTEIEIEIRDIPALRRTCAEMGLDLLEKSRARGYGDNSLRGDYVIRLKGPYDIALNRTESGGYRMEADRWQGHVEKETGRDFGLLMQLYGVHKASREAMRKGYTVRRKQQGDGSIRLTIDVGGGAR